MADGSAAGIRHAEVVNWTGQAIVCPRARVAELKDWEETQRPGVYLLVGDDPEGTRPLLYIGEAEHVLDRLKQHAADAKKDFWDQVVVFTNKDANLTKAHVKYIVPKRGVDARGHLTDEGLVVRSGSIGNRTVRDTLSKGWIAMRADLLADGSLVDTGTHIEFRRDVLFASPSAAAAVVAGGVWNGRAGWKNADGVTLGELESGPSASEPAESH